MKTTKTKTVKAILTAKEQKKLLAESSLYEFIKLVHPRRWLGKIHEDVISWWTASNAFTHQLLLLPRDHMKSALVAYRVAWAITKNPSIRVLYISSSSNLAIKQLKFIKDILTSDNYRAYWPEMVTAEEAKREKWTEREISVDHPQRKVDAIRDPTIFTAGLTTNVIGMHCDIAVLDDVVVASNVYTTEGREKVRNQYSGLSSVEGTGSQEWVVGTRYHPDDLYSELISMVLEEFDDNGEPSGSVSLFDIKEHVVETSGDGTGEFLWPRTKYPDGKWYGFDIKELAKKRAQYLNKLHFRAQYYNDPHDVDSSPIKKELFQYYDSNYLTRRDGRWTFKNERLNIFAAVDFAYTTGKSSDYTSIVVIGVDGKNNYYILEIDRFKTDKISEYFSRILKLYDRWGFRKIRAEVTAAQSVIVKDLKDNYVRPHGISLIVDEFKPSRWQGSKEERILAVLEPRYANGQIWHYASGNCQILEEELIYANPAHDDVKDALASVIDFAVPPTNLFLIKKDSPSVLNFNTRFGGVA